MADTNNDKNFNSPALRFPGFTEPWQRIKVDDLLEFFSTNSLSWDQLSKDAESELMNLHYGLIHVGLPTIVNIKQDSLPYIKGDAIPRNYELCENGDVSFADASEDTSEVAKVIEFTGIGNEKVISGLHTIHGRDKLGLTVIGFKGYLFSSQSFNNQTRRIAQGSKVFSISAKNFSEILVSVPSKEEQRKIADLLRLIDERIATQRRLIEDLEKLKSSIVDRTFSDVDGEVVKHRDILEVSNLRNDGKADYSILSASQEFGMIERESLDIDIKAEAKSVETYKRVHPGDYVLHLRSFQGGLAFAEVEGICSPAYTILRPNKRLEYGYLKEYFNSSKFIKSLVLVTYGIRDGRSINVEEFLDMNISIHHKNKQAEIVKSLSVLSDKLRLEKKILFKYEQQRTYLLNQLFI